MIFLEWGYRRLQSSINYWQDFKVYVPSYFCKIRFKTGFTILIQIFLYESNYFLSCAWKKQTGAFATVSVMFQLHQKTYFRVSFSQFSLTKSQASRYPGKLWLTVAMTWESSCALMTSPSRQFCINLKDKAYEKGHEKTSIHIFAWVSWDSWIRRKRVYNRSNMKQLLASGTHWWSIL